jgi:hypothetical protein
MTILIIFYFYALSHIGNTTVTAKYIAEVRNWKWNFLRFYVILFIYLWLVIVCLYIPHLFCSILYIICKVKECCKNNVIRTEPEKVSDIPEIKARNFDSLSQPSGTDVRKSVPHKQRTNLPWSKNVHCKKRENTHFLSHTKVHWIIPIQNIGFSQRIFWWKFYMQIGSAQRTTHVIYELKRNYWSHWKLNTLGPLMALRTRIPTMLIRQ